MEPLVERVHRHQRPQFADEFAPAAQLDIRLDPKLQCPQVLLFEVDSMPAQQWAAGNVRKRRT